MERKLLSRSVLDIRKAEEKDLNEILYKKLQKLTLVHQPTNEFMNVFTKDMFLKANPKACLHVMHFLLTLYLDPEEFKMKFFWPIVDRKSESQFRSSVLFYLTDLNEKHNLNWTHLKNYLIVAPGGMKFLTFLLELIDFIVDELIKKREKELSKHKIIKDKKLMKSTLNKVLEDYENFKRRAKEYEKQIDLSRARLKQNTKSLQTKLNEISMQTGISVKQLTDKNYLNKFTLNNQRMYINLIVKNAKSVQNVETSLCEIKKHVDKTYQENLRTYFNPEKLIQSFEQIQSSIIELKNESILKNIEINFETLFASLNHVIPSEIFNSIHQIEMKHDLKYLELQESELNVIKHDINDLENEINEFEKTLNANKKTNIDNNSALMVYTPKTPSKILLGNTILQNLFINTPPILSNVSIYFENKQRLPFLNDSTSLQKSNDHFRFHSHFSKRNDSTKSLSRFKNSKTSKINNPSHMLKMITQFSNSPRKKLLSSSRITSQNSNSKGNNLQTGKLGVSSSNHQRQQFQRNPSNASSVDGSVNLLPKHCLLQPKKQLQIESTPKLQKFEHHSDNDLRKISTSPSGRLGSIVSMSSSPTIDHKNFTTKTQILIKEKSLTFEQSSTDNLFNKSILEETEINIETIKLREGLPISSYLEKEFENENNNEKNENDMTLCSQFNIKLNLMGNGGSICNVSDSVLNDVED